MLPAGRLVKVLTDVAGQAYTRTVYRTVELAALLSIEPRQPLFDIGARKSGQRFTPVGGPKCLYVSEHPTTSYYEANQGVSTVLGLAQQASPPAVILNIHVHLEHILDVTIPTTQAILGTTLSELTASWRWQMAIGASVPTHDLAVAAFDRGRFQAIRFPSSQDHSQSNLVIWTERLAAPSFVEVHDPTGQFAQRLPA